MKVEVQFRPVADLAPYQRNARQHSEASIRRLATIMREVGWTNPILVDGEGIVAGHKRRLAVLSIYEKGETIRLPNGKPIPKGMVPVLDVSGWTEAQRRAYILADNQTTMDATWDQELLAFEIDWLTASANAGHLTGFDDKAIAAILTGEVLRVGGDRDQGASGTHLHKMQVGKRKIILTADEFEAMNRAIDDHVAATGGLYGFASALLSRARA